MSQTFDFYDQRARAAQAEADKAVLDNVRERELRSARAWREMADRQGTSTTQLVGLLLMRAVTEDAIRDGIDLTCVPAP